MQNATQIVAHSPNNKNYLFNYKNNYTVVGKLGSYYLSHFSPEDGKGRTTAQKLFNFFHGTELEDRLAIVGTASMITKHNGCIQS